MSKSTSSSVFSVGTFARVIFLLSVGWAMAILWQMHSATLDSLIGQRESDVNDEPFSLGDSAGFTQKKESKQEMGSRISELESKIEDLLFNDRNKDDRQEIETLKSQQKEDHKELRVTEEAVQRLIDDSRDQHKLMQQEIKEIMLHMNSLDKRIPTPESNSVKVHIWDDTADPKTKPREKILATEGWIKYNGKTFDDPDHASTPPIFEFTDIPGEADFIIWFTTMARHEEEVAPVHPTKHAHKVIVLDYADGWTLHRKISAMRKSHTELGYFRRSFVSKDFDIQTVNGNVSRGEPDIWPFAYSGSDAMLIPSNSPEADPDFWPILDYDADVYGKMTKKRPSLASRAYFKDDRYDNYMIPYKNRRWSVVNTLKPQSNHINKGRTRVVGWTKKFLQEKIGDPRNGRDFIEKLKNKKWKNEDDGDFTGYVGTLHSGCDGYCFGSNYARHIRDAKVVVTCNPGYWEGDFRTWESLLSGALVMVDKMEILNWMPNPPIDGKHWVVYDVLNETDFRTKLDYYTDPANIDKAEAIAHNGYKFVLKHHMATDRVHYILNHKHVRGQLLEYVTEPKKRAILGLPPK